MTEKSTPKAKRVKLAEVEKSSGPSPTITFNNKVYVIDQLPANLQEFIAIYQSWNNDLVVQRREVFKLEAALRSLINELELQFKAIEAPAA